MKYFSIILALLLVSCNQSNSLDNDNTEYIEKVDFPEYVHTKPKDSLSAEELKLLQMLEKVVYENVIVENNKFAFNLDKDSFLNMGIPEIYYDLLMTNMAENNQYFQTGQSVELNLDSLWQESVREYSQRP